jgi:predicted GTPase
VLERILTARQEALLARERQALSALQRALARLEAARQDLDTLAASVRQLDELFLLVIVGEFNSGKSTFINALLGEPLLEEGVTPTTSAIHLLGWGSEASRRQGPEGIVEIAASIELLRRMRIVDTPGTNALERRHEALTRDFVPRSDLVLFVTSADRPFTESERAFLERIREWGKKLVLVVNKIDFLRLEEDVLQIVGFMEENARRLLGFTPEIFPLASRAALEAKQAGAETPPRFAALERYLVETLDDEERVRLKLANPLGVALRLAGRYQELFASRLELLRDDFGAIEDIERQLALYREDLGREFRYRLTDVDALLHDFEKRGNAFFDETLRLPRILDLLNKAKLKADFERQVVADAPRQIEARVQEVIDWMVASELRQWQAVGERLEKRRAEHEDRIVGRIGGFEYDRERLLATVGRAAEQTVATYDREGEASRMAESVQSAVAGIALLEVGAIGLGTIVTMIATTHLVDVTGILAAGALAALGLFILPARRKAAKQELAGKIAGLRRRLMEALQEQFDREVERSVHRIEEAIAPYTRFVRAERERLEEARGELAATSEELAAIRAELAG